LQTPPNRVEGGWAAALPEFIKAGKLGNRMRSYRWPASAACSTCSPSRPAISYAPNFKRAVLGRQIMSPLDLERDFGLGGDIFHGALGLDQLFSARPMLGHADYRGPVAGLYTCGAGTHPGGGVTGAPGHNAAREVLRDLGGRR